MSERLERQLGSDAKQALQLARRLAGKEPVIKRVKTLPSGARAMLTHPISAKRPYEIQVGRGEERYLDHLVVHEVGHLVRVHQVSESERLLPAATASTRRRAVHQLQSDIALFAAMGLRDEQLIELFDTWYRSVCTQLVSFPADLRIEQWIHDRYPGFAGCRSGLF